MSKSDVFEKIEDLTPFELSKLSDINFDNVTYVEIFDETAIENICSALAQTPKKVLLIGNNSKKLKKACDLYNRILTDDEEKTIFEYRRCNQTLTDIVECLSEIALEEEQCCFDITGGKDVFLVALGIVFERFKEKNIQLHRFSILNQKVIDCDDDGSMPFKKFPILSLDENIGIYGGKIKCTSVENPDFIKSEELSSLWNIARTSPSSVWNSTVSTLANIVSNYTENANASQLSFKADLKDRTMGERYYKLSRNRVIVKLSNAGLLINTSINAKYFSFSFKNDFVKYCLTTVGCLLELKIYDLARNAKEDDNVTPFFADVKTGVSIEWDTLPTDALHTTNNEIDVMMTDGVVPVFVSCKNGNFDTEELYKLSTVAENFGGKYSFKVLVAAKIDDGPSGISIRQRAKDMNIKIVENIYSLSDAQIIKALKNYDSIN